MDEIIAKVDNFALITVRLKEVDRPNFEQKRAVYIACYSVDKEEVFLPQAQTNK